MTAHSPDAVAQARCGVLETMLHGNDTLVEYYGSAGDNGAWERDRERCKRENEAQLDALIAAVRAECAAKVRDAQGWEPNTADGGRSMYTAVHGNWLNRAEVLAALEAQP